MKVIDFRCRPLTQEWLDFLEMPFQTRHAGRARAGRGGKFQVQSIEDLIREMDDAGISVGVVLGRDVEATLGWKWDNDKVAEIVSRHPDRFIGYAGVDPNKGMEAVREVDRAAKLGLKGVSLDPFLQKTRMNDKKAYPIYAKCVEHGMAVSITTGLSPWGADWAYMDLCNTMDVDEVATDFPELTIVLSHAGFPWVFETLAICRRHPNVYLETSGIGTAYAALGGDGPYVQAANGALGDQFVFGGAAPYYTLKTGLETTRRLPFKPEVLEKVLYHNAARILKL